LEQETRYYLLVGDEGTWRKSFEENLWGFSETSKGLWNTIKIGDFVGFYVTSPIKRIVGFGKIKKKTIDETIFWPDEKFFKRSIWKYRIEFNILHKIEDWENGIRVSNNIMLNVGRKLVSRGLFFEIIKNADSSWNTNLQKIIFKGN